MASGRKTMKINTQERAVSTDINRLQAFAAADLAEMFRYWMNVNSGTDDLEAGAVLVEDTTLDTPLTAEIVNGLLVRPQLAALDLLVDAGVMFALAPDDGPDDSDYKFIHDPGIQTLGTLTMTAGGGGDTRIDIIEVQVSSEVVETDNRDIFNPTTGLFTATSVTKATQGTCTTVGGATNIRVRAGTPGAGIPARANGWLPLCVACVPVSATTCDDMTFWDVRPLLSDREFSPFKLSNAIPRLRQSRLNATTLSATKGWLEASYAGRRLGGRIRRGTPGTDAESISLSDVANQENAGCTFVAHQPYYVYLLTPFGLPRWARYTDASSGSRIPRSPRGIPVVSMIAPDNNGVPVSAIVIPTSTGLGGSTQAGVLVAAGWATTGPAQKGFWGSEDGQMLAVGTSDYSNVPKVTMSLPGGNIGRATFTPNTDFPANAKALLVAFDVAITPPGSVESPAFYVAVKDPGGTTVLALQYATGASTPATTGYTWQHTVWIPLRTSYPTSTPAANQVFDVAYSGGGTLDSGHARIIGWRL